MWRKINAEIEAHGVWAGRKETCNRSQLAGQYLGVGELLFSDSDEDSVSMKEDRSSAQILASTVSSPSSFSLIFDRYSGVIGRFLSARVEASIVEDLVVETFLQAFRSRQRFDSNRFAFSPDADPVRNWLFGVASNVVRHHRRSEARMLAAHERLMRQRMTDPRIESAHAFHEGELVQPIHQAAAVASALVRLPATQREVLFLRAWADLSDAEIAAALGVAEGTVRSRLSRARETLKKNVASK
jgi:RNA polymerase sigma-70 factor (ECF subfamily)